MSTNCRAWMWLTSFTGTGVRKLASLKGVALLGLTALLPVEPDQSHTSMQSSQTKQFWAGLGHSRKAPPVT